MTYQCLLRELSVNAAVTRIVNDELKLTHTFPYISNLKLNIVHKQQVTALYDRWISKLTLKQVTVTGVYLNG